MRIDESRDDYPDHYHRSKSYRMERGRLIGTLRTRWLADINRQPHGNRAYPLIAWSIPHGMG